MEQISCGTLSIAVTAIVGDGVHIFHFLQICRILWGTGMNKYEKGRFGHFPGLLLRNRTIPQQWLGRVRVKTTEDTSSGKDRGTQLMRRLDEAI